VAGTVGTVAGMQVSVQAADLSAFIRVQGLDVTRAASPT
jgi:hypothetical protein